MSRITFTKIATWANNKLIRPYPKAKFHNSIWRLHLIPNLKTSALKLVHNVLLTRGKLDLRHIVMDIESDCPFGNSEQETINYLL